VNARAAFVVVTALLAGCEESCEGEIAILGVREQQGADCADPEGGPRFLTAGLYDLRAADQGYTAPVVVESRLSLTLESVRVFFTDDTYGAVSTLPGVDTPRLTPFSEDIALEAGVRSDVALAIVTSSEARGIAEAMGGVLVSESDRVRVLAWMTLSGRLGEISSEVTFPIDVCRGCLVGVGTVDGERCIEDTETLVENAVCRRGQEELTSRCE